MLRSGPKRDYRPAALRWASRQIETCETARTSATTASVWLLSSCCRCCGAAIVTIAASAGSSGSAGSESSAGSSTSVSSLSLRGEDVSEASVVWDSRFPSEEDVERRLSAAHSGRRVLGLDGIAGESGTAGVSGELSSSEETLRRFFAVKAEARPCASLSMVSLRCARMF